MSDHQIQKQSSDEVDRLFPNIRELTSARIGIGRSGGSLTTSVILDFEKAHARARDAVWADFDPETLRDRLLQDQTLKRSIQQIHVLHSAAKNRAAFIKRPDLGRRLAEQSAVELAQTRHQPDLILILSDGLSSGALINQSPAIMQCLIKQLISENLEVGPILIIPRARVGIVDQVGEITKARSVAMLLGERPGLSSPESLGIYYTHMPRPGCTDADRNCISNIHPQGLSPAAAAAMLSQLIYESYRLQRSGVLLSEKMAETRSIDI